MHAGGENGVTLALNDYANWFHCFSPVTFHSSLQVISGNLTVGSSGSIMAVNQGNELVGKSVPNSKYRLLKTKVEKSSHRVTGESRCVVKRDRKSGPLVDYDPCEWRGEKFHVTVRNRNHITDLYGRTKNNKEQKRFKRRKMSLSRRT